MLRRPSEPPTDAEVRAWVESPDRQPPIALTNDVAVVAMHLGDGHPLDVAIDLAARATGVETEIVAANWEGVRALVAWSAQPDSPAEADR